MTGRRNLALGVLAGAVLSLQVPIALADHSWANYHWGRTANPFGVKFGDNVTSVWDLYLVEAKADWSKSDVLDADIVSGGTDPKRCKATSGMVQVCNAKYGRNGWLGIAQIWISGTHILQGVAKMNDTYFSLSQYNNAPWRDLVMCQEVAHTFGLGHNDEIFGNANKGTCMDYTNDPDGPLPNLQPNDHDLEQLVTIYGGHLDSANTTSASPSSTPGAIPEGGREWGQVIAYNARGLGYIFEADLGNGFKRITHVFWTLEARRGEFPHHD